jgi:recombination protein U
MGKHLEFEVKQTSEQNFNTSIIKSHQWDYLDHCINFQIIKPFLIIYFNKYEKFYLINFDWMNKQLLKQKTKTIKYEIIESECIPLGIVFPGIIDFIKKI